MGITFAVTVEFEIRFKITGFEPIIRTRVFASNAEEAQQMVQNFFKQQLEFVEVDIDKSIKPT